MSRKPRLISVKLTEESRKKLLEVVPPRHTNSLSKTFADHITLHYKPSDVQVQIFEALKDNFTKVKIRVFGHIADDKGQAVCVTFVGENDKGEMVFLPPGQNKVPHITISCAEGVLPVYSNELLENVSDISTIEDLDLEGYMHVY